MFLILSKRQFVVGEDEGGPDDGAVDGTKLTVGILDGAALTLGIELGVSEGVSEGLVDTLGIILTVGE